MEHWTKAINKHFNGEAPALVTHASIHIEDKTVVALYFETLRAIPFVIKNPAGGYPEFEVPWRSGTRLRAAKREELLQILLPVVKAPQIQILNAELNLGVKLEQFSLSYANQPKRTHIWTVRIDLYITPQMNGRIFIPHKNCEVQFNIEYYAEVSRLPVKFKPIGQSLTIKCSETELIIDGPGSVCLESQVAIPDQLVNQKTCPEGQAELLIKILPNDSNKQIVIERELKYVNNDDFISNFFTDGGRWVG